MVDNRYCYILLLRGFLIKTTVMKKYIIVYAQSNQWLEDAVNIKMKDGYIPTGGITIQRDETVTTEKVDIYMQPMYLP